MDKQGNLIPDAHYIFSALPDSSLLAEGELTFTPAYLSVLPVRAHWGMQNLGLG